MTALQKHLKEIIHGKAFKGSLRSAQFLTYIVEQAIAGNFDRLKERVIGAELFQRPPSYDTGEDAIVRVTASDVRKRLLQHYDRYGATSGIRISLPLGSYTPEIKWDHAIEPVPLDSTARHKDSPAVLPIPASDQRLALTSRTPKDAPFNAPATADPETSLFNRHSRSRWLSVTVPLAVLNLVLAGVLCNHFLGARPAQVSVLPWSALFNSPHPLRLITSDPAIVSFQGITGGRISLMDYENHNYHPERYTLAPETRQFLLWGDWTAPGTANRCEYCGISAEQFQTNQRAIGFKDSTPRLENRMTTSYFILGSPRSDPWISLFNDGLDFQFFTVDAAQNEQIRNVFTQRPMSNRPMPQPGSPAKHLRSSHLFRILIETGRFSFWRGESGLGTDIAGRLVTDLPRLSLALQKCGIPPSGPLKHFELLLRVSTMAGSSRGFEVAACHVLPDSSAH